jgi:hypothetical protein
MVCPRIIRVEINDLAHDCPRKHIEYIRDQGLREIPWCASCKTGVCIVGLEEEFLETVVAINSSDCQALLVARNSEIKFGYTHTYSHKIY